MSSQSTSQGSPMPGNQDNGGSRAPVSDSLRAWTGRSRSPSNRPSSPNERGPHRSPHPGRRANERDEARHETSTEERSSSSGSNRSSRSGGKKEPMTWKEFLIVVVVAMMHIALLFYIGYSFLNVVRQIFYSMSWKMDFEWALWWMEAKWTVVSNGSLANSTCLLN